MRLEVVAQLLALNKAFYATLADPFAQSRDYFQAGYPRLLQWLPQPCPSLLDVGCGEGRLGRFLIAEGAIEYYVGIDFSPQLLQHAGERVAGRFVVRDISQPGALTGLGDFPAIACLSTLQHVPGRSNRIQLLTEMADHLRPGGILLIANWQFVQSERQRKKIVDWSEVGLTTGDVEKNDYLLSWKRGALGWRYVCLIDAEETVRLAREAGLTVETQFRSDGREGNLNLYAILRTMEVG